MKKLRELILKFCGLSNKQRKDWELDEEIESHLQLHIEDNIRLGMTPDEARRQAMIQFGGIESTKESYRDQRGLPVLDTFFQDIRFGARQLRKNPGFAAVAVLTLALGIGANTAIFSVVDAVLLRPLAYPDSGQLVWLCERGPDWSGGSISHPNFTDWRNQQSVFERFGVYTWNNFTLTGAGEPVRLAGALMSADVFAALRTQPEIGMVFREDEDKPGTPPVVVISHALWQSRFGGQAGIVNKTISLNGNPYSILGVMPAGFEFPNKVDLWLPVGPLFAESSWQKRDNHPGLFGLARLKAGVTLEKARGDLDVIAVRLEQQYPESNRTRRVQIDKLLDNKVGNVRRALWILLGAVSFVLVIACANVANLLLARAALKDREPISIRAVTPDYFATLGMRIVAGRGVRTADAGNSAEGIPGNAPFVAVINQSLANVCFPGRDPLGKRLRLSWRPEQPEVVGVVSNTRTDNLTQQARSELCFSMWQSPAWVAHLVVRRTSDPQQLAAIVQRAISSIEPAAAIEHVKTLDEIRQDSVAIQTFTMRLLVGFSFGVCVLALVGLYGVLSVTVGARRKEIAIRSAIGAQRHDILRLILGDGMWLIALGLFLGAGVALLSGKLLSSLLFEVRPVDPATLIGAALLFATAGSVACWLPARRASRIDPMEALRDE